METRLGCQVVSRLINSLPALRGSLRARAFVGTEDMDTKVGWGWWVMHSPLCDAAREHWGWRSGSIGCPTPAVFRKVSHGRCLTAAPVILQAQGAAMAAFRSGEVNVLVCTNVGSEGAAVQGRCRGCALQRLVVPRTAASSHSFLPCSVAMATGRPKTTIHLQAHLMSTPVDEPCLPLSYRLTRPLQHRNGLQAMQPGDCC